METFWYWSWIRKKNRKKIKLKIEGKGEMFVGGIFSGMCLGVRESEREIGPPTNATAILADKKLPASGEERRGGGNK